MGNWNVCERWKVPTTCLRGHWQIALDNYTHYHGENGNLFIVLPVIKPDIRVHGRENWGWITPAVPSQGKRWLRLVYPCGALTTGTPNTYSVHSSPKAICRVIGEVFRESRVSPRWGMKACHKFCKICEK